MKRKDSILGTYNAQKLPKVKIGNGQFVGGSLLPNIDFLKQLQQKEKQRPRFSVNPYMFGFNPQRGVNIHGIGAGANLNLLNSGRNRLDLTGNASSVSVGYPGGVDLFGKPQFSGGLKFTHTFGDGGQNAFRKRNFEQSLPDYRVDPILKFYPGGEKKTDSKSEKEKIKELEEIIITAPLRKKTVQPKKTSSLPAVNYKPFVPTVSADYFKQKTYAPNSSELTPYDLYELYDQEQDPVVQPSVQTPSTVYYPTQTSPVTLQSLYNNKASEQDAYMQILEQFDPERAQLMKMMNPNAFNNNYFFNGGFLMPAKHGGWLDRYAPGGETAGGKVPPQGNNQIPPQQPTAQTGAPSGPIFSNQYVPQEEEKRNRFYDFAMGALGVGAFLGSTGLFNKKKKFKNDQSNNSDQPDLNSQFPVRYNNDGNGKPQGGGSSEYSDGIVGSPEARGAGSYNTQGSFNSYQGNFAKLGGNVGIYGVRDYNQDVLSNFVHGGPLKRYNIGGANNPCPPGWVQNEKGECVQDEAARRALAKKAVDIARQRISSGKYYEVPEEILNTPEAQREGAFGCIGGVCSVLTDAGVMSKPNWSNADFALHARDYGFPNKGYGLDQLRFLEPGDVLQYYATGIKNRDKQYPHHGQLFLGINENGEYEFFDNYAGLMDKGNSGLKTYSKEEMEDLFNPENVENLNEYGRIYKVNPWTAPPAFASPEAEAAFNYRQGMLETQLGWNPGATYSMNPESYFVKNKLEIPQGMQEVINFGNDDEKMNSLLQRLHKINLGNIATKGEAHNSLQNVFGILGQENKWDNRWFGGDYGFENTFENVVAPYELSIGPGQIKFSQISPQMKKEFGIENPRDLFNWEKLIPLMVARDLENKNWMKNQGENLGLRITGSPVSYENLPKDYTHYSPYFWRGYGLQIREKAGKDWEKDHSVDDYNSRDDYNAAKNKWVEDNLSRYQKSFDAGSYGRNVINNKKHLTWSYDNFHGEKVPVELPAVVVKGDFPTRTRSRFQNLSDQEYINQAINPAINADQTNQFNQDQFAYGGDISIPDLEQSNWLDRYDDGGQLQQFAPGGVNKQCPNGQFLLPNGQCGTYADLQRMMASSTWNNIQKSNQMVWQSNAAPAAQPAAQTKTTQPKSNKPAKTTSNTAQYNIANNVPEWTTSTEFPTGNKVPIDINYEDVTRRGDIATQTGTGTEVLRQNVVGNQAVADKKYQIGVQALVSSGMSEEQADRQYRNYKQNPTVYSNIGKTIENYESDVYNITTHPDYDPNKSLQEQKTLAADNSFRTSILRGRNKLLQPTGNTVLDFATGMAAGPGNSVANLGFDAYNRYGKLIEQGNYLDAAGNFVMDLFGAAPITTTSAVLSGANRVRQGASSFYNTGKNLLTYGRNKALGISTRPPYITPYMPTQVFPSPTVTQVSRGTNAFPVGHVIQQGSGPRKFGVTLNFTGNSANTAKGSTVPTGMVYTNKDVNFLNQVVPTQYQPNLNLITTDLGERIGEGGAHNLGVYLNKANPDELIKIEKLGMQQWTMGWPGYKDVDLVGLTSKVGDNPYIGNVTRSVPLGDEYRALYLKKVPGKQYSNLSTGAANKAVQPGNALDLFNKIKRVTRNDMTFDFAGDNIIFNPNTGRSSIFDLSPNVPYNPLDIGNQSNYWMTGITKNIHLPRQPLTLAPTPTPKINFTPRQNWSLSVPSDRLASSQNIKSALIDKVYDFEKDRLNELANRYVRNNPNWGNNEALRNRWYNFQDAYMKRAAERQNVIDRTIDLSNFNIAYKKGGLIKKQKNKWLDNI